MDNDSLSLATKLARKISAPVSSLVFEGKIYVHTTCENEVRLDEYISSKGGEVKSSTVLKTDYLIIGDKINHETSKITRAEELNKQGCVIKTMTESEFWRMAENLDDACLSSEETTREAEEEHKCIEAERIAEEERRRLETERKAEEERKRLEDVRKAEEERASLERAQAKKKWEDECQSILKARDNSIAEYCSRIESEIADKKATLMSKKQIDMNSVNNVVAKLESELTETKRALDSLGIFGFGKKKDLTERITTIEHSILGEKSRLPEIEKKYSDEIENLEKMLLFKWSHIKRKRKLILFYPFAQYNYYVMFEIM